MTRIRTEADLVALEAAGLDAFLPHASPAALLRRAAETWPDRVAIHYLPTGERLDFAGLWQRVRQAASLFRRLGPGRGGRWRCSARTRCGARWRSGARNWPGSPARSTRC